MSIIILPNKDGAFGQPTNDNIGLSVKGQYKQDLIFNTIGSRTYDLVTGAPYSGAPARSLTKFGQAIGRGQLATLGRSFTIPANSDFTFVWSGRAPHVVAASNYLINNTNSLTISCKPLPVNNRLYLRVNSVDIINSSSAPLVTNGAESVFAIRFKNATSADSWFGTQSFSVTHSTNSSIATITALGASSNDTFSNMSSMQVWTRYLDDSELIPLLKDPYFLFSEEGRYSNTVYFKPSGGGTTHTSTGALIGQGSAIAGAGVHNVSHASTGDLVGQGSAIVGASTRFRAFTSTGALIGQGSTVAGTATHNVPHSSTGDLVGQGSEIAGVADRQPPGTVTHVSTGSLTGQGSSISGSASRFRAFTSTGALVGQGSTLAGVGVHNVPHASTGALIGQGSTIAGSASRTSAPVTHTSTGALIGQGSELSGSATRSGAAVLTPQDLLDIADAVWAHSSAVHCQLLLTEVWGRLGLDITAPLISGTTQISFGSIVMAMTEAAGTVTVTRQ